MPRNKLSSGFDSDVADFVRQVLQKSSSGSTAAASQGATPSRQQHTRHTKPASAQPGASNGHRFEPRHLSTGGSSHRAHSKLQHQPLHHHQQQQSHRQHQPTGAARADALRVGVPMVQGVSQIASARSRARSAAPSSSSSPSSPSAVPSRPSSQYSSLSQSSRSIHTPSVGGRGDRPKRESSAPNKRSVMASLASVERMLGADHGTANGRDAHAAAGALHISAAQQQQQQQQQQQEKARIGSGGSRGGAEQQREKETEPYQQRQRASRHRPSPHPTSSPGSPSVSSRATKQPRSQSARSVSNRENGGSSDRESASRPPTSGSASAASKHDLESESVVDLTPAHERTHAARREDIVTIHLMDENRKVRKDFFCAQDILSREMKYFRQYLALDTTSDSLDISVHCDVKVFEWLMCYVEHKYGVAQVKGTAAAAENGSDPPKLNLKNVVSILISSHFLQMDDLMDICLQYVHAHINSILKRQANLACINNDLLTRLASRFTISDFAKLKDKKDKLASKLYWKKLELLFNVGEPLHDLYQCAHCLRLVLPGHEARTQCLDDRLRVDHGGRLVYCHEVDKSWDVNEYLAGLRIEGMSPADIFWRVQGYAYRFTCSRCLCNFAATELRHCRYHPRSPEFHSESAPSAGTYPCCNKQVLRFEPAQLAAGCAFREHDPQDPAPEDLVFLDEIRKRPTALLDTTDPSALRRLTHTSSTHPFTPPSSMHLLRYRPTTTMDEEDEDDEDDIPEPSTPRVVVRHRLMKGKALTPADIATLRGELRCTFLPQAPGFGHKPPTNLTAWSSERGIKQNLDIQRIEDGFIMQQMVAALNTCSESRSCSSPSPPPPPRQQIGAGAGSDHNGNNNKVQQRTRPRRSSVGAGSTDPIPSRRGSSHFHSQHSTSHPTGTKRKAAGFQSRVASTGARAVREASRPPLEFAEDGVFSRIMQREQQILAAAEAVERAERAKAQRQHPFRRLSRRQSFARSTPR